MSKPKPIRLHLPTHAQERLLRAIEYHGPLRASAATRAARMQSRAGSIALERLARHELLSRSSFNEGQAYSLTARGMLALRLCSELARFQRANGCAVVR